MTAHIIHWDCVLTFRKQAQAVSFIKLLLDEEIVFSFSYYSELTSTSQVYIVDIDDMCWSNNLITLAKLLQQVDYEADKFGLNT